MARNLIVPIILCLTFSLFFGHAQGIDDNAKSAIVKGILKRVLNYTLASFTNVTNQERKKLMHDIKEKLRKSSQFLGKTKSDKYVELIMDGVRSLTAENYKTNNLDDVWDDSSVEWPEAIAETHIGQNNSKVLANIKRLVKKTSKKINAIAVASMKDVKTPEEREYIENRIQHKVIDAAIKKHISKNPQNANKLDTNSLSKFIMMGMREEQGTKNKNAEKSSQKPDARRMEFEFTDTIDVNKNLEAENSPKSTEIKNYGDTNKIKPAIKNVNFKLPCKNQKAKLCINIETLSIIKCGDKNISLEKLCDGFNDCADYTDENSCAIQGVDKVRRANQIMTDIDRSLSDKCYTSQMNDTLIAKQNEILNLVLKSQMKFLQKHATEKVSNSQQTDLRNSNPESATVKKIVHEIALVITTLSSALKRTLCSSTSDVESPTNFNALDDNIQQDFDYEAEKTTTWSPNSCKCIEDNCEGRCRDDCETLCLQRYQLDRWQCKAVSGKKSIPLDFICDGKLDCFDESDENGCTIATGFEKFEAANLYNFIIEMISTKTKKANFESIRSKMIDLQAQVKELQKLTSRQKVDVTAVRSLRNQCFSVMTTIYDLTKYYALDMNSMHDIHKFLMSVSDKLIIAMKRSHTGNDKIIASDGCLCSENKCALQRCSEMCMRACPAEPKLTRYFCGGSMLINQSIPIEALCNGKVDCPGKDDEDDCSLDICRRHHLVVLRHNLREIGTEKDAMTMTDALISWKTKESAMLRVFETNDRPSPMVLRDTVKDMLHDLVMAYASTPSSRRHSNDDVIQKFYRVALVVMNALKSCSK